MIRTVGEWFRACGNDEIKDGEMRDVTAGDKRILLARVHGRLLATDITCTHAEADLSNGFLSEEGVRCPLHLSVFDLESGAPRNPPAETPLRTYSIKVDDDSVYVEI